MPALAPLVAAVTITVTAPWPNGGTIPKRYTCDGADATPALGWWKGFRPGSTPPRRPPYAIEVVDVGAPGGPFVHWLQAGGVRGRNSFGTLGYRGPCPPPGDRPHRYVFRVLLLDRRPALRPGFTEAQLRRATRGHVVASGTVVGRYGR